MKTLKIVICTLGLAGFLFSTACSKDPWKELEKAVDELCECKDAECVKKVKDKIDKIEGPKDKEPSEEDIAKALKIMGKMQECESKIAGAAGGGE